MTEKIFLEEVKKGVRRFSSPVHPCVTGVVFDPIAAHLLQHFYYHTGPARRWASKSLPSFFFKNLSTVLLSVCLESWQCYFHMVIGHEVSG